jgi:hypothetical protein
MPTQEVITERFLHLQGQVDEAFKELFKRFQSTCEEEGAVVAMDRLGMEIAETECYAGLLYYGYRHLSDLPAVLEHSENVILRGDWQPVSPCSMHRALHQAQSLARCKFIKRLREVLNDDTD